MSTMSEQWFIIRVSPEARSRAIRSALDGRLIRSKLTAGQRRAVEARKAG